MAIFSCSLLLLLCCFYSSVSAAFENARGGEFKFQAALLRDDDSHYCGGTILTQKWVLTSAYCIDQAQKFSVFAGASDFKAITDRFVVKRSIKHPSYDASTYANNIALVELMDPIKYTDYLASTRLPIQGQLLPNKTATLSGWPVYPAQVPNMPNPLQVERNYLIIQEGCTAANGVPKKLQSGQFCGGVTSSGKPDVIIGACLNDFGCPLSQNGVAHGILSSAPCQQLPEIFIKVSDYIDWIKATLGSDASDLKFDQEYSDGDGGASLADASKLLISFLSLLTLFYLRI